MCIYSMQILFVSVLHNRNFCMCWPFINLLVIKSQMKSFNIVVFGSTAWWPRHRYIPDSWLKEIPQHRPPFKGIRNAIPLIKISFKLNNYIKPKEFWFTWGKLSKLYIWFSHWPLLLFKHSFLFLTRLFPSQKWKVPLKIWKVEPVTI